MRVWGRSVGRVNERRRGLGLFIQSRFRVDVSVESARMGKLWKFRHPTRAERLADDLVLLVQDAGVAVVEGRAEALILPLIDRQTGAADIAVQLNGIATVQEIETVLAKLAREGFLMESVETETAPCADHPPVVLQGGGISSLANAGWRSEPPEQTFERLRRHIDPSNGIVSRLEPRVEDPAGIYVYVAHRNFALTSSFGATPRPGARRSAGRGATASEAKASALCEALERYSGVFRGREVSVRASYRELADSAIHPHACLNFSARQYAERDAWNAREGRYNWVPVLFDESLEVDWTSVWSLTAQRAKFLPTAYCYYNYPVAASEAFCRADSNGVAAGSTLEEAILAGFLELVERDCVAMWWYNRARRPSVALRSFPGDFFRDVELYYRSIGREVWVLDITGDFEIPAMAAISRTAAPEADDWTFGCGAHFEAKLAIARALGEMNQFLPSVRAQRVPKFYTGAVEENGFLLPDSAALVREAADFPPPAGFDLKQGVEFRVERARRLGLETLVLEQTRPDPGLCVARVIVPGMRPLGARFAPGRLYVVPAKLGWLELPRTEGDLNPAHLIF